MWWSYSLITGVPTHSTARYGYTLGLGISLPSAPRWNWRVLLASSVQMAGKLPLPMRQRPGVCGWVTSRALLVRQLLGERVNPDGWGEAVPAIVLLYPSIESFPSHLNPPIQTAFPSLFYRPLWPILCHVPTAECHSVPWDYSRIPRFRVSTRPRRISQFSACTGFPSESIQRLFTLSYYSIVQHLWREVVWSDIVGLPRVYNGYPSPPSLKRDSSSFPSTSHIWTSISTNSLLKSYVLRV